MEVICGMDQEHLWRSPIVKEVILAWVRQMYRDLPL